MVGHESERHKRYKRKVADLLRSYGFVVAGDAEGYDDEFSIIRPGSSQAYYVDICASNNERVLVVEIDGYRGHNSHRRIQYDVHRTIEIKSLIKDVEVFRFAFWQLKGMDEDTIAEELRLIPSTRRKSDRQ